MNKLLLILFPTLLLASCTPPEQTIVASEEIEIIIPSGQIAELIVGETMSLHANVLPLEASQDVKWEVDNPLLATISDLGVLLGVSIGEVTITATALDNEAITDEIVIKIIENRPPAPPESVEIVLEPGQLTKIIIGQTLKLDAYVFPLNAPQEITWSSSNQQIATISNEGTILGISEGTALITATATGTTIKSAINFLIKEEKIEPPQSPIKDVLDLADEIQMDKDGNGEHSTEVTFNATYISYYVDGTKSDRVALLTDGVDIIYVRVALRDIDNYILNQTYQIQGHLTRKFFHLEMSINSTWKTADITIAFDLKELSTTYTLEELNTVANSLVTRDKGAIFTEIVDFTATIVAKTDNSKALFYDGKNVISIHGDNKLNNQLPTLGSICKVYGFIGKYTGMPSVEFLEVERISSGNIEDIDYTKGDRLEVKLSSIYQNTPDSWESPYFPFVLKAEVYIDVNKRANAGKINKDNDLDVSSSFLMKEKVNGRISWQNNTNAEAIIIRNSDDVTPEMIDAYYEDQLIEVTFVIYQYLSNPHMWAVHIL